MSEENELLLTKEITEHFKMLKKATVIFGSMVTLCLIPLVSLIWTLKAEQIEMNKTFIRQTEVYDNFVNKGQYMYLQGEWIEMQQRAQKGTDITEDLKEQGRKIKEVLEIKYRSSN